MDRTTQVVGWRRGDSQFRVPVRGGVKTLLQVDHPLVYEPGPGAGVGVQGGRGVGVVHGVPATGLMVRVEALKKVST